MEKLSNYEIPFAGLKTGKHVFTYEIGEEFFENFEYSPIKEGDVYVHLTFDKKESFFILSFFIDGSVITDCDRCLEDFELPINGFYNLYVKFSDNEAKEDNDDPDVIFISRSDISINVATLIYDYINLSLPIQKTCEMSVLGKKKCNEEIIKKLNETAPKEAEKTDPRWDLLKNLNKN